MAIGSEITLDRAETAELLRRTLTDSERLELSERTPREAVPERIREDEESLSAEKKQKFRRAYETLIQDGRINALVNIHADMRHRMHTMRSMPGRPSLIGTMRFLGWHRAYLLEFENLLRSVDPDVAIPYWCWTKHRRFPGWLSDFLPRGLINRMGMSYDVNRQIGRDESLPDPEATRAGMQNSRTYTEFTLFLEGADPYGAHNQVHVYVGGRGNDAGEMSSMYSPADSIFWLHHAECDRLWHIWQTMHANEHPSLLGRDAVMDPWDFRYKDLADIDDLGYGYDNLVV